MGNTTKRCEAPTSEVDDCAPRIFGTVAYVTCGKAAAWSVETDRGDEYDACEHHAWEALSFNEARRVEDANGEQMAVEQ